jgi:four helix bundle protein
MGIDRGPARTFRDLVVWQKAHSFVLDCYRFTSGFPKHETYGLVSQMRRAIVSVAANIAEGFRKRHRADKCRFMNIAEGSLEESRYYLMLAQDPGYGETQDLMVGLEGLEEVSRLLNGYLRAILTSDF